MTDAGSHRRHTESEVRPQPERPEFVVAPLRPGGRGTRTGSTRGVAFRVASAAWVAVATVFLGLAAVVVLNHDAVRNAMSETVASDSTDATSSEIADTVTVTLWGSAGIAALLLAIAGLGLALAFARRAASGIVLLVAGLATIGASVLFWSFMSDADEIAASALRWGPLLGAGCAAIATVAAATGLAERRR